MTVDDNATAAAGRLAAIRAGTDALLDEDAFRAKAEARLAALPDIRPHNRGADARAERAARRPETSVGHHGNMSDQDDTALDGDRLPATDLNVT